MDLGFNKHEQCKDTVLGQQSIIISQVGEHACVLMVVGDVVWFLKKYMQPFLTANLPLTIDFAQQVCFSEVNCFCEQRQTCIDFTNILQQS
jgi:hypothetical protein